MDLILTGAVFAFILGAEFVNGWTDAPNAIATVVSTRVLSPRKAVLMASVFNILGAFSGTAVAATIGKGIVKNEIINLITIAAAMLAIIIWSTLAWKWGLPTSESHGLIAGLSGAGLATAGPQVLLWEGWGKVIIGLFFSTLLGLVSAYCLFKLVRGLFKYQKPGKTRKIFGRLQIFSAGFMAFSHGSNDGQKFMGVFALALVLTGFLDSFTVPIWVILLCAIIMGIGTSLGGWRIIKTMGVKMVKLQTPQGFSAETAAALVIASASQLGIPLSTTHTIGTSIIGTGLAYRRKKVHLRVIKQIVLAWILTFPVCGGIAYLATLFLNQIF